MLKCVVVSRCLEPYRRVEQWSRGSCNPMYFPPKSVKIVLKIIMSHRLWFFKRLLSHTMLLVYGRIVWMGRGNTFNISNDIDEGNYYYFTENNIIKVKMAFSCSLLLLICTYLLSWLSWYHSSVNRQTWSSQFIQLAYRKHCHSTYPIFIVAQYILCNFFCFLPRTQLSIICWEEWKISL